MPSSFLRPVPARPTRPLARERPRPDGEQRGREEPTGRCHLQCRLESSDGQEVLAPCGMGAPEHPASSALARKGKVERVLPATAVSIYAMPAKATQTDLQLRMRPAQRVFKPPPFFKSLRHLFRSTARTVNDADMYGAHSSCAYQRARCAMLKGASIAVKQRTGGLGSQHSQRPYRPWRLFTSTHLVSGGGSWSYQSTARLSVEGDARASSAQSCGRNASGCPD